MEDARADRSACCRQLLTELQLRILSHLPPNECALRGRLVFPNAAVGLNEPGLYCTAFLSQPLPPHAVPWAMEAGQQHVRLLPFRHQLQLLSTAAASGSEVNLEAALALLQPSIFPEMLITGHGEWSPTGVLPDPGPGEAAVKGGYPQLLGWVLHQCPALVCPRRVLEAAAEHCDLAGLQGVWRVLNGEEQPVDWGGRPGPALDQSTLNAAARSLTPDAVAKMEWVLGAAEEGRCSLSIETVENAAHSGDLGRLRWLQEQGCQLNDPGGRILRRALQYADMAVVQWLVDEAGCELLGPQWGWLVAAAAKGPDGLARVLWLQQRGVVLKQAMGRLLEDVRQEEAECTVGQARTLQYVMQPHPHAPALSAEQLEQLGRGLRCAAVASGSIPLVEELRQAGTVFDHRAYYDAGRTGGTEMTRWLATEAQVSAKEVMLEHVSSTWPRGTSVRRRQLLEVVQLLVGAGAGADGSDVQEVVHQAAAQGNLPLVQFLAQHLEQQLGQQPYWQHAIQGAAEGGCEALLEWLAGKAGSLADAGLTYLSAARRGDKGTLAALRRLGVPCGEDTVAEAVEEGCQVPVLQWLVEQGAPVGSEEMEQAVARREGELGADAGALLRGLAEVTDAEAAAAAAAAGRVWPPIGM